MSPWPFRVLIIAAVLFLLGWGLVFVSGYGGDSTGGSELVFLKARESEEQIELCSFPSSGPVQVQADLTHLAFEVDDLEAFGEHLAKLGLRYPDGPTTTSTGTVFAFLDAPEGYEIELIQRAKQAGKGGGC